MAKIINGGTSDYTMTSNSELVFKVYVDSKGVHTYRIEKNRLTGITTGVINAKLFNTIIKEYNRNG